MGRKTKIGWTDATWNPVRGCSVVSAGCTNCYAQTMAARFAGPGEAYEGLIRWKSKVSGMYYDKKESAGDATAHWSGKLRLVENHLLDPLRWKKPRKVFVNSMSDLFHENLAFEDIATVFGVMAAASQHTFQVLTKRPERAVEFFRWLEGQKGGPSLHVAWEALRHEAETVGDSGPLHCQYGPAPNAAWPLPNVWIGVSVENQRAANERIPLLLQIPAAIRFLSCEPLLESLDIRSWLYLWECKVCSAHPDSMGLVQHGRGCYQVDSDGGGSSFEEPWARVDWVIVGAESGPKARGMDEDWVRSLRDQCVQAGVPFFYKQKLDENGIKVEAPELDGKAWQEFPAAA